MVYCAYLAHHSLYDGIKSTLRSVSISGHLLLLHFLCEARHLLRQRQDVPVAELSHAHIPYAVDKCENKVRVLFTLNQSIKRSYVLKAGVPDGQWRVGVHVRCGGLVHEGSKPHAQIARGLAHALSELVAQGDQAIQVVFHRVREVHQVVEVHGVVLHLLHRHRKHLGAACGPKRGVFTIK